MSLVEDQSVVSQKPAVPLDLGQQDPVGHQLDQGAFRDLVGESHRVADHITELGTQFISDTLRDGASRESPRLGVTDRAAHTASEFQTNLGQLGRLARAGLTCHHHHLVFGDGRGQLPPERSDRKIRIGDRRHGG